MKQEIKEAVDRVLREGTWATPSTSKAVSKIVGILSNWKDGDEGNVKGLPTNVLYKLLGDDMLYDKLGKLEESFLKASAKAVVAYIKKAAKLPEDSWKNKKMYAALQELVGKI